MRIIRWGWIVLAGVLAESLSIAFLVGLRYWHGGSARAELSALGNATFEVELGMKLVAGAVGGGLAGWQASARTRAPVS